MSTERRVWQLWPRFGPGALLHIRRGQHAHLLAHVERDLRAHHIRCISHEELSELPEAHTLVSSRPWEHALYLPDDTSHARPKAELVEVLQRLSPMLDDASMFTCHGRQSIERINIIDGTTDVIFRTSSTAPSLDLDRCLFGLRHHMQRHPDVHGIIYPRCESCRQPFEMQLPPTSICTECETWQRVVSIPRDVLDEVVEHLTHHRRIYAIKALREHASEFMTIVEAMDITEYISQLLEDS